MKKINEIKPGAKKQLFSGMVYIALAVTVVAATVGTVVSTVSDKKDSGGNVIYSEGGGTIYNGGYTLKLPEDSSSSDMQENTGKGIQVSDSPYGINAEITKVTPATRTEKTEVEELPQQMDATQNVTEPVTAEDTEVEYSEPDRSVPTSEEPEEIVWEYGYDGFVKPCSGFVSKAFSMDVPVYSVSMYDYRTHSGIDIVGEIGTPVKAVSNGVITDIYDDYLYGTTVVIEHTDGVKSVYSNLSPDLPVETVEGKTVITGEVIAGIGESAVCEYNEAHHLHLEMMKNGEYVDPEEYLYGE